VGLAVLLAHIDEYTDEEGFVNGVVKASMYHSGQVCVSVQRIYVAEKRMQDLAQKILSLNTAAWNETSKLFACSIASSSVL
jgi:acyl-CoA reductase-like NAD-dependent aldehyde dehydrogenase